MFLLNLSSDLCLVTSCCSDISLCVWLGYQVHIVVRLIDAVLLLGASAVSKLKIKFSL